MEPEENRWLRVEEVATSLGVCVATVRRAMARLSISHEWRGARKPYMVIRETDAQRILDDRTQKKAA